MVTGVFNLAVLAASAASPAPAPPAASGSAAGVTHYPATYFAAAQPNTAWDMIQRLPGFVFDDGDTVRGFAGAAGNVLIDGLRPTSKTDDLQSILRRIPASRVELIELIRGAAPGIDMQGKTVIANVIRKPGASDTAQVTVADGWVQGDGRQAPSLKLEGAHQASDGASTEGSLNVERFYDDGEGAGPEVSTAPDGAPQSVQHDDNKGGGEDAQATGAYSSPLAGGTFRANAQLSGMRYTLAQRDQDATSAALQPTLELDHQDTEQAEFGLTYDRSFGAKLSTETLFIQQFQGEDFSTDFSQVGEQDRFREGHDNGETILHAKATYVHDDHLTIEAGGEGDFNWLDSHTTYASNGVLIDLPAADVQVKETRGEVFAKSTWVMSPKFTLESDLRVEASQLTSAGDVVFAKTLLYPKPRLILTWSPDRADQLRLRAEKTVGQLDFANYVASSSFTTGQIFTGNPNLLPQQALVLEAAYERQFWKTGDLTLTVRHSDLTEVLDRAPVVSASGDYDEPANIGSGDEDELAATLNVPLGGLGLAGGLIKANVTWRSSRVTDPTTHQPRPLGGLSPREGTLEFDQDLPRHKLNWGAIYNLGVRQPYYSFSEIEIDVLRPSSSLFVEYKPNPRWSFRGELDDIGADARRTLEIYPDLRSKTPLQSIDIRDLFFSPVFNAQIRRAF